MLLWVGLFLLLFTSLTSGQLVDETERADWVDPSDMVNFNSASRTMKREKVVIEPIRSSVSNSKDSSQDNTQKPDSCKDLDKCQTDLKEAKKNLKTCQNSLDSLPPSEVAYLKQFIRVLVEKLPHAHSQHQASVAYSATLLLSQSDLDLFNDLIYTERGGSLQDSHRALVSMIQEVKLIGDYRPETWYSWTSDWLMLHLMTILQMMAVFALATVGVLATARIQVSWFSFFGKLLLLLFLISIPWNWWHLYKIELAQRQAKAIQDMPAECKPEEQGMWVLLKSAFSVNVDKCAKYHEQMMVDPIWEVAPTRAIAVTLTKFCVEPLEHIGRSLGKFIRAPLEDLPVQMWPIVLIFLVVVFTLALIMGFGYKIRLFYLFGIEPDSGRKQIQGVEELQKGIQALTAQVENLSRDSNKAADTEMIVERKLQALTNTPHWEGRGDWHRPRYLENVGHQRGMDRLDGRMGLNGEGFVPMPTPEYPPAELYPPAFGHPTIPAAPAKPVLPQHQKYMHEPIVEMPVPQKVESVHTPIQASGKDGKPEKTKDVVNKGRPVTVETVAPAVLSGTLGPESEDIGPETDDLKGGVKGSCSRGSGDDEVSVIGAAKWSRELMNGEDLQSVSREEAIELETKDKVTGKVKDKNPGLLEFKDKGQGNKDITIVNGGETGTVGSGNGGAESKVSGVVKVKDTEVKDTGVKDTGRWKNTEIKDVEEMELVVKDEVLKDTKIKVTDDNNIEKIKDSEIKDIERVKAVRLQAESLRPEVEDLGPDC